MSDTDLLHSRFEHAPLARKAIQCGELFALFAVPVAIFWLATPIAGDDPVARMTVVWGANIAMLTIVYVGLRLRGQTWAHLGLKFGKPRREAVVRTLLQSLVVCAAAGAVFLMGAVAIAGIAGMPEKADMSSYNYLYHNLPLLIGTLIGVYIVSSFGEEVIYRAFLITRIQELGSGGKTAQVLAVLISAAVFGSVHFDWGPLGMAQTGLVGLVFAIAYLKVKRNLWVNILAHGYMDTILIVQLYFVEGTN